MTTCGKGHDLAIYGFPIKNQTTPGCRACRTAAANSRWEKVWPTSDRLAGRFWPKVDVRGPGECWPWLGAKIPSGYGSLGSVEVDGRNRSQVGAHRISFFLANGYWPRITRHTCDNPPCVNPAHLLDGDVRQNALDMVERGRCPATQRTHCPQGHPYSPENTYVTKQGHRHCRTCMAENARRQTARRAALTGEAKERHREQVAARQRAYKARKRAAASGQ